MGAGFRDAVDAARSSRELVALIERALESLTDTSHAKEIARLAFDAASEDFDVHDPEQRALFIHGPLADAVETVLGARAIDTVCSYVEQAGRGLVPRDLEESGEFQRPPAPLVDASRAEPDTLPTGPRPLVLLVSSNEALRDQIDPWVSEAGYALVWCPEADTVVAQCTAIHPQLVILDEDMPGLHRRQVVGLMQHTLGDAAPPRIAVGRLTPESTTGLDAFLRRPLDRTELVARINQIAERPKGSTPPPPSPAPASDEEAARLLFLLEEAMGRLVAVTVRDAILADALDRGQLVAIPSDIQAFTDFVVGPLVEAVTDALGDDLTEALLSDLEPVVMQARESSGLQRRPSFADRPFTQASDQVHQPPEPRRRLHVVVLADEGRHRRALADALSRRGHRVDETDDAHGTLELCVTLEPHAVVVSLTRSAVSARQFCALMELTLAHHRPFVVVASDGCGSSIDGADRVVSEATSAHALARGVEALVDETRDPWTSTSDPR